MKKIIKVVLTVVMSLLFVGCGNTYISDTPVLSEEDINVDILHHEFAIDGKKEDFLGFIVSIDHDEINKEDLSVEIYHLDAFSNINQELTNNSTYTSDFINEKVEYDDYYINITQCFIVETEGEIFRNLQKHIEIIIRYQDQAIKTKQFVLVEI